MPQVVSEALGIAFAVVALARFAQKPVAFYLSLFNDKINARYRRIRTNRSK